MSTPHWGVLADLKTAMGITTSGDDAELTRALCAAEDAIALACHRDFAVPAGGAQATTRKFVPGEYTVQIDDLADSTALVVDNFGTSVTLSTVELRPLNAVGPNGRTGWPITQVYSPDGIWYTYRNQATVSVTSAKWGWTATPEAILEATYLAAKDLFNAAQISNGQVVDEFGPAVVVSRNVAVSELIAPYVKSQPQASTIHVWSRW